MDVTRADDVLQGAVAPVVRALTDVGADPSSLMLVGAVCRDVLHQSLGHDVVLRRTSELDIAIAVDGWDRYRSVASRLQPVPAPSRIRFHVAGSVVDLAPFGSIEDPSGAVPGRSGDDTMNVVGFRPVRDASAVVALMDGLTICVPTVPGFTALKLSAWASRSAFGEYRDGTDIACAMYWYTVDAGVTERLYDPEGDLELLLRHELDHQTAAVELLVRDALRALDADHRRALLALWTSSGAGARTHLLAQTLRAPHLPGWPTDARRLRRLAAIASEVFGER